jgi:translation initiation factor IF-3
MIKISPIRLIGPDNEQIGVVDTSEALRRAMEAGLDLVEISPDARPPVCKIMDYGKYKYELSKQSKNKGGKAAEMKELRLGRSVKIDPHDIQVRVDQARRFLLGGHKVMFTQRFRGREITHKEIGLENLAKVRDALADLSKVEQPPRWFGKAASIILAPDKPKVDAIKRKLAKEKAEREGISEEAALKAHEAEAQKALEAAEAQAASEVEDDDDDEE